jgi:hypothetical protein
MYRQILTPTAQNPVIPITIPREWYGKQIEVTISPVKPVVKKNKKKEKGDILKYFGAWKSDRSAEEIIADIYNSRSSGKTRILEEL